jgi:hypothetical protein
MKLTVGSLPSAVYWRRRAIVFAVVLFGASIVWVSCSGPDTNGQADKTHRTSGTQGSPASSLSPSFSVLAPTIEGSTTPGGNATSAAVPVGGGNDAPAVCADSELLITPAPETVTAPRGQPMRLTIKIKNISARACPRDLGADAQELYLMQNTTKVYSTDACDPRHGTQVRTMAPGSEQVFYVAWDGNATTNGCAGRVAPPAGKYDLIGRLGTKISDPVAITLT